MRTYNGIGIVALGLLFVACGGESSDKQGSHQQSVDAVFVAGNPSCTGLGYDAGFKVDPPSAGTYNTGFGTVTVTTNGVFFDWTSTFGIDAVISKGGPNSNVYIYDPPAEAFSGTGLHSPINPNTGTPYGLSHIEFCYDWEVSVSKTANPSLDRQFAWTIDKTSSVADLTLSEGQMISVPYTVTASVTGHTDSNWAIGGSITISNPAPMTATITGVVDTMSGQNVPVDCGVTFPHPLASGGTLTCSYSVSVNNADTRINNVAVTTSGTVGGGSASATADFANAAVSEIDECVNLTDDKFGSLGTACASESPKTFTYSLWIGPYQACGTYEYSNTASFVTNDTQGTGSDSWTIPIDVPCLGCTLTQGYWKTHSSYGPAPYDDTWALLPQGADTPFYKSGLTYIQVLWSQQILGNTAAGHAYYLLAHQFIAAQLNNLNGASLGAVQAVYDEAAALFEQYTPAEIGALKGAARRDILELAGALDAYNNGVTGPGHCDE